MSGYDIDLIGSTLEYVDLPLMVLGGAGQADHLKQVVDIGVQAAVCGSLFNFGDNNPLRVKATLKNYGISLKNI
jgi:cyclase